MASGAWAYGTETAWLLCASSCWQTSLVITSLCLCPGSFQVCSVCKAPATLCRGYRELSKTRAWSQAACNPLSLVLLAPAESISDFKPPLSPVTWGESEYGTYLRVMWAFRNLERNWIASYSGVAACACNCSTWESQPREPQLNKQTNKKKREQQSAYERTMECLLDWTIS